MTTFGIMNKGQPNVAIAWISCRFLPKLHEIYAKTADSCIKFMQFVVFIQNRR